MSYILEALRKMERQRRRDSEPESWIDDLSAQPDEGPGGGKAPGRMLVAVSILFGISGILAGILFYHGNLSPEAVPGISEELRAAPEGLGAASKGTREAAARPVPPPGGEEGAAARSPLRGVTLSEIKTELAARNDEKTGTETVRGQGSVSPLLPPVKNRVIDLTDRFKLTSTGRVNDRPCATIDRRDYYVGDAIMNMVVSEIEKDRVYLRDGESGQRYVIVFRYRKP